MKNAVLKWLATLVAAGTVVVFVATFAFGAENPSMQVTLVWPGLPTPTCTFNDATQTVVLDDIAASAFSDKSLYSVTPFDVRIKCDTDVTLVKIIPSGTPDGDDETAFSNTGSAKHVALRLLDQDKQVLLPDGTIGVSVVPSGDGEGNYTFSAGYVATAPGQVTAGNFASTATLSFEYD